MKKLKTFLGQLDTLRAVALFFQNPFLIILLRLGILKLPYFLYRIKKDSTKFRMLARPTTTSMADLFVLKEIFIQETYADILKNLPQANIRFVDVGGNIGAFVVWLASKRKISKGFIFEPLEENRRLLTFNLDEQKINNVEVIPAALGGHARQILMELNKRSPGGSSIYKKAARLNANTETIKVKAFHHWLEERKEKFHLLKLDCEGAEWEILETTPKEYFQCFYIIIAEVHATVNHPDVKKFKNYFNEAGFETLRWDNHSHGLYIGRKKLP